MRYSLITCMAAAAAAHALTVLILGFGIGSCLIGDASVCQTYSLLFGGAPQSDEEAFRNGLTFLAIGIPFYAFTTYACLSYLKSRKPHRLAVSILLLVLSLLCGFIHFMALLISSTEMTSCLFGGGGCSTMVLGSILIVQFTSLFAAWACWALAFSKIFPKRSGLHAGAGRSPS